MRKIASTVPSSVSRLLQSTLLQTPPTWYQPLLSHPPPVLPPRQSVNRPLSNNDLPSSVARAHDSRSHQMKHLKGTKPRPKAIVYEEDRIRRQFFKDFPFEALRPVSLVEGTRVEEGHPISGENWTSLAQRGAYPTVEDCIQFTLNLHHTRKMPLTEAYSTATTEFVTLRAEHELATQVAEAEARHYGASGLKDPFERTMRLERKALDTLAPASQSSQQKAVHIKKKKTPAWAWTASVPSTAVPAGEFTGGRSYVEKWQLPSAAPASAVAPAGDLVGALEAPEVQASEFGADAQAGAEVMQQVVRQT